MCVCSRKSVRVYLYVFAGMIRFSEYGLFSSGGGSSSWKTWMEQQPQRLLQLASGVLKKLWGGTCMFENYTGFCFL